MTKEKMVSLVAYIADCKSKLSSAVPVKHKDHPESYKNFLKKEIEDTTKKVDSYLLSDK